MLISREQAFRSRMMFSSSCKAMLDIILATFGLILSLPVFLIVSMLLIARRESVFFRHERVGKHGEIFNVYKFTTMSAGAEKEGTITIASDNRITSLGGFLRKYKINELPQLFNVLKGEMSFIGPRPLPQEEICYYEYKIRNKILSVKPGITGLATIKFISEESLLDRFDDPKQYYREVVLPKKGQLECHYVDNWSLALDTRIFWETTIKLLFMVMRA